MYIYNYVVCVDISASMLALMRANMYVSPFDVCLCECVLFVPNKCTHLCMNFFMRSLLRVFSHGFVRLVMHVHVHVFIWKRTCVCMNGLESTLACVGACV